MGRTKRKSTSKQSTKNTKSQKIEKSNRSITSIEDLSNEFFYEIFDYLRGYEIYQSFSNLNSRFQELLNSSSLLLIVNLWESTNKSLDDTDYMHFVYRNTHKISSMGIYLESISEKFLSSFNINSSLSRLETLLLDLTKAVNLTSWIMKLSVLPRLYFFTLILSESAENLDYIYQPIFALPQLKSFRFLFQRRATITLPMNPKQYSNSLEHLMIYHCYTPDEIITLLSYAPNLRRLHLYDVANYKYYIKATSPVKSSNVIDTYLRINSLNFNEFEMLIQNIFSNIKFLRVITEPRQLTYLNSNHWEQLILKSLPQLEKFYLTYIDAQYDINAYHTNIEQPNQFTSSFWTDRRWIFDTKITDDDSIDYNVRPYRKRWYEYISENNFNSPIEYSKSARLTISAFYYEWCTINDIEFVLLIAPIYHLEISVENTHIFDILNTLYLLPELDSLRIHSLELFDPSKFTFLGWTTFSSVISKSKITKVYIETMNNIEDFDFLSRLCPYMEYFKSDDMKRIDIKFALRHIFKKLKEDGNVCLNLLCFRIPTADDEMVRKLNQMINREKLLYNYTIKRSADLIYLQWKL